jgi:glyoxylase-like metal-dependent hydrolase (beta-lactamase superfamily II)
MKEIAPSIYASTEYPGVNVGFIAMPAGAIAVDAPTLPQDARDWRQQVVDAAGGPILYVLLTDTHPDRLLGAAELGAPIVATREAYEQASAYTEGFWRGVVDAWARYHPEAADDLASARIVLPEILFTADVTLRKGGVDLTVTRIAGAAPGSAWLYLPGPDVLFSGDTMVAEAHPYMAAAPDTEAWLKTLRTLRRPRFSKTRVFPGRGELCDGAASRQLSDYIALARRRVRSLHLAGRPRADTARLVAEFLPRFPTPDEARARVQRRIKAGLDRVYEELRQE